MTISRVGYDDEDVIISLTPAPPGFLLVYAVEDGKQDFTPVACWALMQTKYQNGDKTRTAQYVAAVDGAGGTSCELATQMNNFMGTIYCSDCGKLNGLCSVHAPEVLDR